MARSIAIAEWDSYAQKEENKTKNLPCKNLAVVHDARASPAKANFCRADTGGISRIQLTLTQTLMRLPKPLVPSQDHAPGLKAM